MEGLPTFRDHLGTYTKSRKLPDGPATVLSRREKSTSWYGRAIAFYTIDDKIKVASVAKQSSLSVTSRCTSDPHMTTPLVERFAWYCHASQITTPPWLRLKLSRRPV